MAMMTMVLPDIRDQETVLNAKCNQPLYGRAAGVRPLQQGIPTDDLAALEPAKLLLASTAE